MHANIASENMHDKLNSSIPVPNNNAPMPIINILLYGLIKLTIGVWKNTTRNEFNANRMPTPLIPYSGKAFWI
jgi:hypothetical protein